MKPWDLYLESFGHWLERKDHLADVLDGLPYVCETKQGRIVFTRDGKPWPVRVQVLGTVAGGYWLWGWANETGGFPPEVMAASRRVREIAEERGLDFFLKPRLSFSETWTEQKYAVMACGLVDGQGTFRWNWGDGTIFFLIDDPDFPADERLPWERAHATLSDLWENVDPDDFHQAAAAYLSRRGARLTEEDGAIVAALPGRTLTLRFDDESLEIDL